MNTRHLLAAAIAATSLLAATAAEAKIYAFGSYAANFSATPGTGTALVPLTSAGKTNLKFKTTKANTDLIISFSAECANDAASIGAWVDIDVVVDGNSVSPTNQASDAFCSADETAGFGDWSTNAVNVVVSVPAGTHTVEIHGRSSDNTSGIWVSDTSTIIHD